MSSQHASGAMKRSIKKIGRVDQANDCWTLARDLCTLDCSLTLRERYDTVVETS
jgi:hypothetical protein